MTTHYNRNSLYSLRQQYKGSQWLAGNFTQWCLQSTKLMRGTGYTGAMNIIKQVQIITIILHRSNGLMNFTVLFQMCKCVIVEIIPKNTSKIKGQHTVQVSHTPVHSKTIITVRLWPHNSFKSPWNKYDKQDRKSAQMMRWEQQLNHGAWNSTMFLIWCIIAKDKSLLSTSRQD